MNRCMLILLSITMWATCNAETPPACEQSAVPLDHRPPVRDFTGALPIPDYLGTVMACNGLTGSGETLYSIPAPPSAWMESEKRLYTSVLVKHKVDVLIVPFQVQGYGFDRIERAVMTADLAYAIAGTGQHTVADPFLVSRALGEGMRRFSSASIQQLADQLGAAKVVIAYVGHDQHRSLYLTIQVRARSGKPSQPSSRTQWQKDWRGLAFTNERPPIDVFHQMLPEVLRSLPLGLAASPAAKVRPVPVATSIAGAPLQSVTSNAQRVSAPALLSLLGTLSAEADELSRERLFEKALVASMRTPDSGARGRFLEAHALMYLHRRPGALARLKGQETTAGVTLRGVLNGDLPAARKAMAAVKDPFERLLLQASLRDLEINYGRNPQTELDAARQVFDASYPAWQELVEIRAGGTDPWSVAEAMDIKQLIDTAFPVPGMDAQSLLKGMAVARGELPDEVDTDLATARHVRKAVESIQIEPCCHTGGAGVTRWDLLWLLEGLAETRIAKSLNRETYLRGLPAEAMDVLNRIEPLFSGHPRLAVARAWAALKMAENSPDDMRRTWNELSDRSAGLAAYWAQGQGWLAANALFALGVPSDESRFMVDAYGFDFPRRPFWPAWFFGVESDPQLLAALTLEGLAFSCDELEPLGQYGSVASPDEYRAVITELGSRFTGHPERDALWAFAGQAAGQNSADPLAQLRAAIENDPEVWDNYLALGNAIVASGGRYEDAGKAFLSYPDFRKKNPPNPVGISNAAYEAGSLLFWQGQPDLAKPLYQIAADLDTGSDASMSSALRLQLLAGDYRSAAFGSLERATRYSNPYAYRDYLSFLHAFGMSDEAWMGFSQVMAAFDVPQVWVSALVGHRRSGIDEAAVRAWLLKPEIRGAQFKAQRFAPYYAILWNSTDRLPPTDFGALVEKLDGPPVSHIDSDGRTVLRPHPLDPNGFESLKPSPFRANVSPKLAEGTAVKSDLAYFADAYAALRRRNYRGAVTKFNTLADRYPIEKMIPIQQADTAFALPYFAYAAAKTGDTVGLEKYVQGLTNHDFDYWLARAFFAGVRKDVAAAQSALEAAFRARPHTDYRPIMTEYQYAEACEWLYQETHDARFIAMLLDWVKSHQRIQPTHAWAYAMQYTYEKTAPDRMRALALTYYLDPASERITGAPKSDVDRAKSWLKDHNPFAVGDRTMETRTANASRGGDRTRR